MNYRLVSKLLGSLLAILSLAFIACFGLALRLDEESVAALTLEGFGLAIGASLLGSAALYRAGRRAPTKFFRKEALCVIGVGWLLCTALGAIPYWVVTPEVGAAGAIFESASGLTTTGASVFTVLEEMPRSLMFWRCLSQWIGGMGVVVFFVAILGFMGAGAKMLYVNEASGSVADLEDGRVQSTALRLVAVYLSLSALCSLSFWLAGMDWFEAVCHMFATLSTGGFSTRSGSLADFDSPLIEWIAIAYMAIGGVSFFLILRVATSKRLVWRRNTEFTAYWGLLIASTAVIAAALWMDGFESGFWRAVRPSAFQVVSIMTTTGFATEDFAAWGTIPQAILLVLMVVGGCSGSTAGGIKVARLVVGWRMCLAHIERSFRPRVVRRIKMNGHTLSETAGREIVLYLVLVALICLVSLPLASLFEPRFKLDTDLSAVVACLFNIGPGLAEVGPTQNFAAFHPYTKLFFSLLMIMGRLELYAVIVLFVPSFWRRFD